MIGYEAALAATLAAIEPLQGAEPAPQSELTGRVLAEDVLAPADSPAIDISLKDALRGPVGGRGRRRPGPSRPPDPGRSCGGGGHLRGQAQWRARPFASSAARPCPRRGRHPGEGVRPFAMASASQRWPTRARGRNLVPPARSAKGQLLVPAGTVLRPAEVGLIAAAGYCAVPVVRRRA